MAGFPSWAQAGPERRSHVERVAALMDSWARVIGIAEPERERWLRAAYLHDALRDAPHDFLLSLAPDAWNSPELLHGPAAAVLAERQGEKDQGILDAVRFHSVGCARWDWAGCMLYLADYLEPGRKFRQEERRAMALRVPAEPDRVLHEVAAERLQWVISSGWPLFPETVDFWNSLPRES